MNNHGHRDSQQHPAGTSGNYEANQQPLPRPVQGANENFMAFLPPDDDYPIQATAAHQCCEHRSVTVEQEARRNRGKEHGKKALKLAILGIFVCGLLLGPLALREARKASSFGRDVTLAVLLAVVAMGVNFVAIVRFVTTSPLFL